MTAALKAHSSLLKNTRIPKFKAARRTVGHRDPFANPVGAAGNYPAALTCASLRLTWLAHLYFTAVDLADWGGKLVIGFIRSAAGYT
ncbi:MAG: hypothetical protein JO259_03100 [Mycobacterium sp.]|nr:hypothetical protein [Mycobacterium sp.]